MAQSAKSEAERWATCFDELPEPERATALAIRDVVRQVVRARAPQAQEAVKWGYAARAITWVLGAKGGNMCSIMGAKGYVRLQFFRGAELDDPTSALEGTGKGMAERLRHLKVYCNQPLPEETLRSLVASAIALHAS